MDVVEDVCDFDGWYLVVAWTVEFGETYHSGSSSGCHSQGISYPFQPTSRSPLYGRGWHKYVVQKKKEKERKSRKSRLQLSNVPEPG